MTITRVGTTEKYANGWEQAFGKAKKSKSSDAVTATKDKPASSKKAATKAPAKAVKKAKVAKTASKTATKTSAKPTAKKVAKKK